GNDWRKARPEEDSLCLRCHALNTAEPRRYPEALADGVGCENCHGAAQNWLEPHFRDGWRQRSAEFKEAYGFKNLSVTNLAGRAAACVDCHVGNGAKGMKVNHQLIAAGHPRLNFEYSRFMAKLPKHWDAWADQQAS